MAQIINALPRFIELKAQRNDKYLIHLRDDHDYLQFSGTDFASLHAKYEVVPSSTADGLVHLKCCYNNMYWVCREIEEDQTKRSDRLITADAREIEEDQTKRSDRLITADAREIEEDQTKRSCTLFKPVFFTSNRIGFCHVHFKENVIFQDKEPHYLGVGQPSKEGDYLDFFDWESLPILPRYIALKGYNGNYLRAYHPPQLSDKYAGPVADVITWLPAFKLGDMLIKSLEDPNVYLSFNCKDKGDQAVGNEVFITPDGKIRLKSNYIGKFWRASPNWIWPDSEDDTNNDPHTLFEVTKLSHNKISLRNLGNKLLCMSITADGKDDCLNACSDTTPETAKFQVEELVDKRKIFNVFFHEKVARTYEMEISNDVRSTDLNETDVAQQATLEFEYTEEESQTWTTSNSLKQTVETEITVGTPTEVVQGKLKYAHEVTTTVEDGKTLSIKRVKKYTKTVNVPPHSMVVANFRVTQALCDVPYSYSQTDIQTNGTPLTYTMDDGLYTCVRTEVFFHAKQQKM